MSLGRVMLFAVGAAAGVAVGYAVTRSETAKSAAVATTRAGLKAKDWATEKYEAAKEGVRDMVEAAKAKNEAAAVESGEA